MLTSKKIAAYSKIVAGLPDVPSPAMSALQIKQWFDTAPEEMRVAFNALIDNLISTATGDSGAESIGIEPIVGVSAANVQNALEQLKLLINDAVAGAIPDGSIGVTKLSFDPATQPELDAHASDFTAHVEYALATGAANTYAVTLTPAPSSYVRGMAVSVEINALNTGSSTININGMGAKSIKKSNGNDVAAGNLKVGIIYTLRYNGTNFILQGEGGSGNAVAADLRTGKTATVDSGDIVGTLQILAADILATRTVGGVAGTATNDANALVADILSPKTAYVNGVKLTGTGVAGKKFANGSTVVPGDGTLTVTGLTFLSTMVVFYSADNVYVGVWSSKTGVTTYIGRASLSTDNVSTKFAKTLATVTGTGFSILTDISGTVNWYAYE